MKSGRSIIQEGQEEYRRLDAETDTESYVRRQLVSPSDTVGMVFEKRPPGLRRWVLRSG